MGQRGPAKTPTAILKVRGSRIVRSRENEPVAPSGTLECSDWISDEAKAIWSEIVPPLAEMGILCPIDQCALARYCVALSWWRKATQWLNENEEVYPVYDKHGKVRAYKKHPYVMISNQLEGQLRTLERAFGLSPSARAGLSIDTTRKPLNDAIKNKYFPN